MNAPQTSRTAQYISFFLSGEEYAISVLRAREVVEYSTVTRVPNMPTCVRGVVNLRGRVLPVIDLASQLGLPATDVTRWTCILVVEINFDGELTQMGLLVDSVCEILDLAPDDIEPSPPFGARIRLDYMLGLAKVGQGLVILLDIDRILSPEELFAVTSMITDADSPFESLPEGQATARGFSTGMPDSEPLSRRPEALDQMPSSDTERTLTGHEREPNR